MLRLAAGSLPIDTAILAGLAYDELFGEPPTAAHPVAWLGTGLDRLEQWTYRSTRPAGVAHVGIAIAGSVGVAKLVERVLGRYGATVAAVGIAGSGRMLREVATTVGERLQADDLDGARRDVVALVGRNPTTLGEAEIVRAVIESVAENTVDAVTATLFWAAVGGPVGVVVHRTVNTLDAMVGHRSSRYQQFGWASARLDDLLNWAPARLTAVAVALATPSQARQVVRVVVRDGGNHPSPNGGVVEAAFAAALDITLGGTNDYGGTIEVRGPLGVGPKPVVGDVERAVSLARRASWIFAGLAVIVGRRRR